MGRSLASKIEEANRAILVDGRLDEIGRFFAADYLAHGTRRDVLKGLGAVRKFVGLYRRAFPDLKVELQILVVARDRVAWQRTVRGTHRGTFRGFPATGRRMVWRDVVTSRFDDGLIAEDWVISDLAEQLLLARKPRRSKAIGARRA